MPEPLLNDKAAPSDSSLTLGELWRFCADKADDRQLTSLVIIGVLTAVTGVAIGVGIAPGWMLKGWSLVALLLALGSFGVWAIADREIIAHHAGKRGSGDVSVALLATTRWLAAVTAMVAAGSALLYGFFAVLGTWIS